MGSQANIGALANAVTPKSSITYEDVDSQGQIHVLVDQKKYLVKGALYERTLSQDAEHANKWSRKLVATTPGYQPSADADQSVIAQCPKTEKSYRIVGQFKAVLIRDETKPMVMTGMPVNVSERKTAKVGTSVPKRCAEAIDPKERALSNYKHELNRIAAQRNAGLDPQVRMSFITTYVGESKASLYRKFGYTFPLPIKRGRSSFWTMSSIEAYKAGGAS